MARAKGTQNRDYEQARAALASSILRAVLREGPSVSLHELAREAGVTIPTLKHYFGDRTNAIAAGLRTVRVDAAAYIASLADPGRLGLRSSLEKMMRELTSAWVAHGVGRVFSGGLAVGIDDEQAGPGYLDGVLEPTLAAVEARLRVHARREEIDVAPDDELALRSAALALLSPVVMALLHQHALGGTRCRPLDVERFTQHHLDRFRAAYAARRSRPAT